MVEAPGKESCLCHGDQEVKRQEKALKVFIFVFIVDISACTLCASQCLVFPVLVLIMLIMDFYFFFYCFCLGSSLSSDIGGPPSQRCVC